MFSFRWEPPESPRPAGALWSIATERCRPGPTWFLTTLCCVGHSLGSPHWQQAWASPRLPVGARRRHQELEGLSPQSHPFLVGVIHPVSDWELQPRKQLNCVLQIPGEHHNKQSIFPSCWYLLGTGYVVHTAPAVLLIQHLLERHFPCQNCLCLDVSTHLPSSVAFRCCSYTYQSHFPPSFQSDSPVLSKQEETLLKSSITFLFSSSIPAQTRGDNTESFKYLIYKEKSLLKRDQLMHF